MRLITVCAAIVLTGCAAKQEMAWTKPNSTEQEFYQDRGQCNAQAFSVAGGNLMQIAIVQNSCMQGKGWILTPINPR